MNMVSFIKQQVKTIINIKNISILEKDIDNFMNKLKPQSIMWNELAERMLKSPILSEKKKVEPVKHILAVINQYIIHNFLI